MAVPSRPAIRKRNGGSSRSRSSPCCCRICFVCTILVAGLAVLVWWLYPDTNPPIQSNFSVQSFGISSSQLTIQALFDVAVTNRNQYAIQAKATVFHAIYKGRTMLNVTVAANEFPAQRTTDVTIPIVISLTKETAMDLINDIYNTCRVSGSSLQISVKGDLAVSTWFVPVWINIPIEKAQSIACPDLGTATPQPS